MASHARPCNRNISLLNISSIFLQLESCLIINLSKLVCKNKSSTKKNKSTYGFSNRLGTPFSQAINMGMYKFIDIRMALFSIN